MLPAILTRIDLDEEGIDLAIEYIRLAAAIGLEAIAYAASRSAF